ncbi:tyrosine-type recombinase/integrase [Halobacillus seohaensis]|uniref:Tyrosine-type recombinase/integrase n=1 Tax=Halobacillus seohaensis TaxID=447421 RepID=A0ABW2ENN3_9BACI
MTVQPIKLKSDRDKMKKALHGRNQLLFTLGISFGLRVSDLLTIRVGDVRGKHLLKLREGKTGKTKEIRINSHLQKQLSKVKGFDDDYLFASRKGDNKPITRTQSYRILNEAAERAGIKERIGSVGCHSLRKSHGWMLYEQGLDITRIMRALNHSSQDVTLSYIGVEQDEIDEAIEAIVV